MSKNKKIELSDDQKWMIQAKSGKEAFIKIIHKHQGPLANFFIKMGAYREDAEDMVQETFIKLYKSLDSYQPKAKFTTYLYTLARHVWVDQYRRQQRKIKVVGEVIGEHVSDNNNHVATTDRTLDVQDCLNRLSEKYREALIMHFFMKFKYTEISKILNIPVGTAKSRVHDGLKKLQEIVPKSMVFYG